MWRKTNQPHHNKPPYAPGCHLTMATGLRWRLGTKIESHTCAPHHLRFMIDVITRSVIGTAKGRVSFTNGRRKFQGLRGDLGFREALHWRDFRQIHGSAELTL
jgi:hypothetical protein